MLTFGKELGRRYRLSLIIVRHEADSSILLWLNMDSSQFTALCDQQFQEGSEQAFAPNASVVHELKEAQAEWQFFLRVPTMGSQPRAQQRREALNRVHMDLMEAIPISSRSYSPWL